MLRSRRGMSNLAEYVILVAVVAGAAIAMQPYVRVRLQGAVKGAADGYSAAAASAGIATDPFEPVRTSRSDTKTVMEMHDAKSGLITVDSASRVDQSK